MFMCCGKRAHYFAKNLCYNFDYEFASFILHKDFIYGSFNFVWASSDTILCLDDIGRS